MGRSLTRLGPWLASVCALLFCGCLLDRAGGLEAAGADAAGIDAGVGDAGPPDAGPPDAGGSPDAGPPDAGPPDAGPLDAGPPDAGPPDAGPPDAGSDAGSACDQQYGSAAGYVRCDERTDECEFVTFLDQMRSCESTCEALGGTCVAAFANEDDTPLCFHRGAIPCSTVHIDDICICSRDL